MKVLRGLKTTNGLLLAGASIISVIVLVTAFADYLPLADPLKRHAIHEFPDGSFEMAPFAPVRPFILGTDHLGRDLLSRVIYGARLTLVMAAGIVTIRLFLGGIVALLATYAGQWLQNGVSTLIHVTSGMPSLIIAGVVLTAAEPWDKGHLNSILWYTVLLGLLEWPRIADITYNRIKGLMVRPFIQAAKAVGLTKNQIVFRQIFPHLLPLFAVHFALEMARTLILIGELALFNAFAGGFQAYQNFRDETFLASGFPDWGVMLAQGWSHMLYRSWIPLVPAMAFFIVIFGFNLMGEGLRRRWLNGYDD